MRVGSEEYPRTVGDCHFSPCRNYRDAAWSPRLVRPSSWRTTLAVLSWKGVSP